MELLPLAVPPPFFRAWGWREGGLEDIIIIHSILGDKKCWGGGRGWVFDVW